MLEDMGWTKWNGKPDWKEIIIDVCVVVSGVTIITLLAYAYL